MWVLRLTAVATNQTRCLQKRSTMTFVVINSVMHAGMPLQCTVVNTLLSLNSWVLALISDLV